MSKKISKDINGVSHGKNNKKPLSKEEYTTVKGDRDEQSLSDVREMYDTVKGTVDTAKTAKNVTVGAVRGVSNGAKHIQTGTVRAVKGGKELMTAVKHGNGLKYAKAQSKRIAKATGKAVVGGTIKTAAKVGGAGIKTAGNKVLEQQIDKSTISDTGIEAAKQGATYLRYADNTRKAAVNTAKTIKNTPQNVKKAIERTKKAAKLVSSVFKSKSFLLLVGVFMIVIIQQSMMSGIVTSAVSAITSQFGWLADDDDDNSDEKKQIEKYIQIIKKEVEQRQKEIDDVYYGFNCDKRSYGTHAEISEFRTMYFNYNKIDLNSQDKYIQIISMAAAKWYTDIILSTEDMPEDISLSKAQLRNMVGYYYDFEHTTIEGNCPHYGCCHYGNTVVWSNLVWDSEQGEAIGSVNNAYCYSCDNYHGCKEITEWVKWNDSTGKWIWTTLYHYPHYYCDNPHHKYLKGGVTNYTSAQVMNKVSLTEEQRVMYEMYYEQIKEWLA